MTAQAQPDRLPVIAPIIAPEPADLLAVFDRFLCLDAAAGAASPDTIETYRRGVAVWLNYCQTAGVPPLAADVDLVRMYRAAMVAADYKPNTIASRLVAVRRLYDALVWRGLRRDNPAARIRPPRDKSTPEDRIRFLGEGMLQALLDAPTTDTALGLRDRAILALMGLHGLRTVEIQRATVGDLNLTAAAPVIVATGKSGRRNVYLRPDVAGLLRRWLAARVKAGVSSALEAPLFVGIGNRNQGGELTRRGIRVAVDKHLAAVGSPYTGCHILRHTAATLPVAAGADLRQVGAAFGHKDPRTTAIYAHVVDRTTNNPADRIKAKVQP